VQGSVKSIIAGTASGTASYLASTATLGYTNAVVMPSWAPLAAWEAVVVFGLGAALVALLIHLVGLVALQARASLVLASFLAVTLLAMGLSGQLTYGANVVVAWVVGAALASLAYRKLRPNNSFKPTPLRGAA
jgi:hypothetical protein